MDFDLERQWRPTKDLEVKMREPMISHNDGVRYASCQLPVARCQVPGARCQVPGAVPVVARGSCLVIAAVARDAGSVGIWRKGKSKSER